MTSHTAGKIERVIVAARYRKSVRRAGSRRDMPRGRPSTRDHVANHAGRPVAASSSSGRQSTVRDDACEVRAARPYRISARHPARARCRRHVAGASRHGSRRVDRPTPGPHRSSAISSSSTYGFAGPHCTSRRHQRHRHANTISLSAPPPPPRLMCASRSSRGRESNPMTICRAVVEQAERLLTGSSAASK